MYRLWLPTAPMRNFQCDAFSSDAANPIGRTSTPGCSARRSATLEAGVRITRSSSARGVAPYSARKASTSGPPALGAAIEVNSGR